MFVQKRLRRQGAEICKGTVQALVMPVPPGESLHAGCNLSVEAFADCFARHASNNRVWRYVFGYNRAGCDNRSISDDHAGENHSTVADPDIVPNDYGMRAPPLKKLYFVVLA